MINYVSDNEGFQSPEPGVHGDPDNLNQVFGLPSYEEVIGQETGVNPAIDADKDGLPPTYDFLYPS